MHSAGTYPLPNAGYIYPTLLTQFKLYPMHSSHLHFTQCHLHLHPLQWPMQCSHVLPRTLYQVHTTAIYPLPNAQYCWPLILPSTLHPYLVRKLLIPGHPLPQHDCLSQHLHPRVKVTWSNVFIKTNPELSQSHKYSMHLACKL